MRLGSGGRRHGNQIERADGGPMFGIGVDIDIGFGDVVSVGADVMWQPNWES